METWHSNHWDLLLVAHQDRRVGDVDKLIAAMPVEKFSTISPFIKSDEPATVASGHDALLWQALHLLLRDLPFANLSSKTYINSFTSQGIDRSMILTKYLFSKTYLPAISEAITQELRQHLCGLHSISLTYDGWTDRSLIKYLTITGIGSLQTGEYFLATSTRLTGIKL